MARLSSIALIIAMNVLLCVLAEEELYSDEFDDFDVQQILTDDALRNEYYNCFMETEPCKTSQQKYLTGIFTEAYQTECKKCTDKQKELFAEGMEWWQKNKPEMWEKIFAKIIENTKKKAVQT